MGLASTNFPATDAPCWRVKVAGCFALLDSEGRKATPRGRKARAIIAYLAAHPGVAIPRDRLMDLLWGDRGQSQARDSLRQSLSEIRRSAGDLVRADRDHIWIEADRFRIAESEAGEDARPLEDLNHITPEFDEWLAAERQRIGAQLWDKLRCEAEALLACGRGSDALPLVDRMRQVDPYNEEWLRLAMQAEFQAGHPAGIEQRFKDMAESLKEDLGVAPAAETRELHDRLLSGLARGASAVDPPEAAAVQTRPAGAPPRPGVWRRPAMAAFAGAVLAASFGMSQSAQTVVAKPPRVAVLPFAASAGVDPTLAEGLSEELLSQLTRDPQLRVIGRTSAEQFSGKAADLRTVGRKLRADYLVEGKVAASGGRMRVLVSLVRGRDGSAVWVRNFSGGAHDLHTIQAAIGASLGSSLRAAAPTATKRPVSGEAYSLLVRAKRLIRNRDKESLTRAEELLREAIRIEPGYAAAWAALAGAVYMSGERELVLANGTRLVVQQIASRALALDPNLAEAHATMGLLDNFRSTRSQAHLKRALELKPGDSQILYWSGSASEMAGDFSQARDFSRKAAALDPLWMRPVGAAIRHSIRDGDRAAALRYLRIIKAGNPAGAMEAEADFASAEADYSRVVKLALTDTSGSWNSARVMAVRSLIGLGFTREGLLLSKTSPFERAIVEGRAPPLAAMIDELRQGSENGDPALFVDLLWQLSLEHRWSDIVALYDGTIGFMADLKSNEAGARFFRVYLGPIVSLALEKAGRQRDAVALALRADRDARRMVERGDVAPEMLVSIAAIDVLLGRRNKALEHLEQAFAKGFRLDDFHFTRLEQDPLFALLRGNRRFERLKALQNAHLARERQEVQALGLL